MHARKRSLKPIIAVAAAVAVIIAAACYFILKPNSDPSDALNKALSDIIAAVPDGENALINDFGRNNTSYGLSGQMNSSFRTASQDVLFDTPDYGALVANMESDIQAILVSRVENASRRDEIYNEDDTFRQDLLEKAYDAALNQRIENGNGYCRTTTVTASLSYSDGIWTLDNPLDFSSLLLKPSEPRPGFEEACGKLEYIDFKYSLPDWVSPAPIPDRSLFGETEDPMEVQAIIETPQAQRLINGQKLDWNVNKELIPGTSIRYYLDDSILSIVWQECEHGAVGTFCETILGDATQLRRKLADDTYFKQIYYYPTELAAKANAVSAVSGDFYDHPDRIYGVHVYDGQVLGGSLTYGQTCYFDANGDMLFSEPGQFSDIEKAQDFVDENNIMFSLCFGPVIVDNCTDVTPYDYPLGEVRDTYARCAIGQLGQLHYLAMTINCQSPDYYVYVTLRQAADSIIRHGCINAYTLDGGQTGSIIINNELINPVQFGVERAQSDIVYFATAVPNK